MAIDKRGMLAQTHLGYDKAQKIDEQISKLLEDYPIEEYDQFWIIFCRTVRTGLDMISKEAIEPPSVRERVKKLEEEILTLRKVIRTLGAGGGE